MSGWPRRLLGRFHFSGVFWYRLHLLAATRLPRVLLALAIAIFATFFGLVLGKIRRAIRHNLEHALGPARWGVVGGNLRAWRTIWNHSWCMTESYQGFGPGYRVEVETAGEEHWRSLAERPGGFIVVTAHVGHWAVGTQHVEPARHRRLHVVREPELDAESQRFIEDLLTRGRGPGVQFHFARGDDPSLGVRLLTALRHGDLVALQGDRPRAGARTLRAELFGQPLDLPIGPAAMARAAAVPILPLFVFRAGRARSRVVFREPITIARTTDREADFAAGIQAIAGHVEWAIRQEPFQWFCFRDLWGPLAREG